eukprot:6361679-Amphidinium_carterae.1
MCTAHLAGNVQHLHARSSTNMPTHNQNSPNQEECFDDQPILQVAANTQIAARCHSDTLYPECCVTVRPDDAKATHPWQESLSVPNTDCQRCSAIQLCIQ